jgi:hypothetical protein
MSQRVDAGYPGWQNICYFCNFCKGPNLASVDPLGRKITLLFHPRTQSWTAHFRFDGPRIVGLTSHGRATVELLQMNAAHRVQLRAGWLARGNVF